MVRSTAELVRAREQEIIAACAALYEVQSFKEITLQDISDATSLTRTSIYNYFQTKEEIFLGVLTREYELWAKKLALLAQMKPLSTEAFSDALAHTLQDRPLLLKLLSTDRPGLEAQSRIERVVEFKRAFGRARDTLLTCLEQHFPAMKAEDREGIVYAFMPFLFGIYPYAEVNDRAREALAEAEVEYPPLTVYQLASNCMTRLLASAQERETAQNPA